MARFWVGMLRGRWTTGSYVNEIAMTGLAGTCVDGGGDFQPVINQPLPTFSAVPSGDSDEDATWRIQYGAVGVGSWSEANQKAIANSLLALANATRPKLSIQFAWEGVELSAYDLVGGKPKVVNGASYFDLKSPVVGQITAISDIDVTAALTISWRTGGRGPRNRGRMYVPNHGLSTPGGVVASADKNTYGNAGRALHDTIEALPGVYHPVVSRTHQTYSTITQVLVGDELDRQQRRRRGRPEVYTAY